MIKFRDRLSFKQAKIAVTVAFVLGLVFSIFQIVNDFLSEKDQVQDTLFQVMRALKAPATIAAHNLDEELAEKVVDSLLEYQPVYSANLYSDLGASLASKTRPIRSPDNRYLGDFLLDRQKVYAIELNSETDAVVVGRLAIKVDGQVVVGDFIDRSIVTLVLGFLRNLILALILAIFFYLTLTKPLAALAEYISKADPENPKESQIPDELVKSEDELGLVAQSLQNYMDSVKSHICQQKVAEDALKDSEQRFKDIAESASDWVWEIDADLKVVYVSERFQEVTKVDPNHFRGRRLLDIEQSETMQEEWVKSGEKIQAREPFKNFQYIFRNDQGELLYWSYSGKPAFDGEGKFVGYRGMGKDLTKEKKDELARQEIEARFRATFEQAAVGIAHLMDDGSFLRVNQKFCDYLGSEKTEILHQNVSAFVHPEDWEAVKSDIGEVLEGKVSDKSFEARCLRANGSEFWGNITLNSMRESDGRTNFYVAVIEDISERKMQEAERRELEEQLHQSQKMETIGRLAGGIAHDFNNILTPVLGYAELVLKKLPKDSPLREKVQRIEKASSRASGLVKQILTFSRQGEGRDEVLELEPLVEEALKLIRSSFPANIYIHTHFDEGTPRVMVDQTQAHQLVMNLCTNSAHAMGHEGGLIEVGLARKEIVPGQDGLPTDAIEGVYACLTIKDNGSGIDKEKQKQVFEPFFTTKEVGKGTGLGLSMVHGIVTKRNGYITIDSEVGMGTTFSIYLPAVDFTRGEESLDENQAEGGEERILLVDDEFDNVEMAREMLSFLGYSVRGFTNPREALDAFKGAPKEFDLVISDQTMPHLSGDMLAREILAVRADVPIMIVTGFSEKLTPEESQKIGIREMLFKPLKMDDLDHAIRKIFTRT